MSHTQLVFGNNERAAVDYGYGLRNATLLAQGKLKNRVRCNNNPDNICAPEISLENPDNSAFVAAGKC